MALDTSTGVLCTSVMDGGKLLAERNILAQRGHAELLLPAIQEVLKEAQVNQRELAGIIAGVGPGSYTGIRIAVTAGKSLAWTLGIPVAGISSLEIMALGAWAQGAGITAADLALTAEAEAFAEGAAAEKFTAAVNGTDAAVADKGTGAAPDLQAPLNVGNAGAKGAGEWVVPLMDARRGQVYTALFEAAPGRLTRRLEPDAIRLMETWADELGGLWTALPEEARPAVVTLAGDTAKHAAAAEKLRPLLGNALRVKEYAPEGGFAGLLGAVRLLRGQQDDSHELQPNYTQLAEAEANKLRMP